MGQESLGSELGFIRNQVGVIRIHRDLLGFVGIHQELSHELSGIIELGFIRNQGRVIGIFIGIC